MANVTFYEKPGCRNNTKQKNLLLAAGHNLEEKSLLTEPWKPENLRLFFCDLPIYRKPLDNVSCIAEQRYMLIAQTE